MLWFADHVLVFFDLVAKTLPGVAVETEQAGGHAYSRSSSLDYD